VRQLADSGLALLQPMRLSRHAIAAALPAVLARRDLQRAPNFPPQRGLGDRLAVTFAGLAGRI
jgi:phytoene synthase